MSGVRIAIREMVGSSNDCIHTWCKKECTMSLPDGYMNQGAGMKVSWGRRKNENPCPFALDTLDSHAVLGTGKGSLEDIGCPLVSLVSFPANIPRGWGHKPGGAKCHLGIIS